MQVVSFENHIDALFYTHYPSGKTEDLKANDQVNVSFCGKKDWISISRHAEYMLRDAIPKYYMPGIRAWIGDLKMVLTMNDSLIYDLHFSGLKLIPLLTLTTLRVLYPPPSTA
jgi:hypothetical protein